MKKVFVSGFGCSLNLADTDTIRFFFEENHCVLTQNPFEADVALVNTCAVKERTENRMITFVKNLREKLPGKSKLIVYGCLASVNPDRIVKEIPDSVVIEPSLSDLARVLGFREIDYSPSLNSVRSNPFVSIIPVSRGCLSHCSFCSVKKVWGHLKSYPVKGLVDRVKRDVASGVKEFWLTGQDVGCYGFDIGTNLAFLLSEILNIVGDFRVRIGMSSPQHIIRIQGELLPLFVNPKLYRFLHIPIQSGSDSVLRLMRRPYTSAMVKKLVDNVRSVFPDMTFSTDVMVGFPGEMEGDFLDTLDLVRSCNFGVVNLSKYGDRNGADSAGFSGKISILDMKDRSRRFSSFFSELALHSHESLLFQEHVVFFSEKGKYPHSSVGRLPNYVPVVVKGDCVGEWRKVRVAGAFTHYVEGMVLVPNSVSFDSSFAFGSSVATGF